MTMLMSEAILDVLKTNAHRWMSSSEIKKELSHRNHNDSRMFESLKYLRKGKFVHYEQRRVQMVQMCRPVFHYKHKPEEECRLRVKGL